MGGYLADVVDGAENNFLKAVLNAVNPKVREVISSYLLCPLFYNPCPIPYTQDGTDYWLGGMDIDRNKGLQWLSGGGANYTILVDSGDGLKGSKILTERCE